MITNKENRRNKLISRKSVMLVLILLSFVMSSSTFAYWTTYVEGAFNSHTMDFTVGSTTYQDYEFVLYEEYDEGELIIDNEIIVDYKVATGDSYNVIFGMLWEDEYRENEDGTITTARIELEYDIYAEINGKEVNRNKYRKIDRVLNVLFDENNPDYLTLNSTTATFNMNIGANQYASKNDYKVFDRSDVMIIVTYTIIYETTE